MNNAFSVKVSHVVIFYNKQDAFHAPTQRGIVLGIAFEIPIATQQSLQWELIVLFELERRKSGHGQLRLDLCL